MLQLSWFKNGVRIQLSDKYQSTYSNENASLSIKKAMTEDSGHYTLLAENLQGTISLPLSFIQILLRIFAFFFPGCVVSSAYLAIEPVGAHDDQQLKSFMEG